MSAWLTEVRARAGRPLLERLRYLESLAPDASFDVHAVAGLDEDDEQLAWICQGLARLIPAERQLAVVEDLVRADRYYVAELLRGACARTLFASSISAVERRDAAMLEAALAHLVAASHERGDHRSAIAALASTLGGLVGSETRSIAEPAAVLAMRVGATPPELPAVVGKMVREAFAGDSDGYDQQIALEELLGDVARAGTGLRELVWDLAPIITCDGMAWRTAATIAALGIDARPLAGPIERAYEAIKVERDADDDPDWELGLAERVERSVHGYATWAFGGADARLVEVSSLAGSDLVASGRVRQAFAVTRVDERFLSGLREIADDTRWTGIVLDVFAQIGRRAREHVARMATLSPRDDGYVSWVEARWRCGLDAPDVARAALEEALAWHAWPIYLQLGPSPARVRAAIAATDREHGGAVISALAEHPDVAADYIPDLVRRGYDALVQRLWETLPPTTFWARVG